MAEQDEKQSPEKAEETAQENNAPGVSAALDILVDEHEEEVSENGRAVRRQGIYLRDYPAEKAAAA